MQSLANLIMSICALLRIVFCVKYKHKLLGGIFMSIGINILLFLVEFFAVRSVVGTGVVYSVLVFIIECGTTYLLYKKSKELN